MSGDTEETTLGRRELVLHMVAFAADQMTALGLEGAVKLLTVNHPEWNEQFFLFCSQEDIPFGILPVTLQGEAYLETVDGETLPDWVRDVEWDIRTEQDVVADPSWLLPDGSGQILTQSVLLDWDD